MGNLAVGKLLSDNGLVLVWCVVSRRHREAVEDWFRAWDVKLVAKWTWLKITKSGEPVVALEKSHKQPFEYVYVGSRKLKSTKFNENAIVCSVPSAVQSHKPPLDRIVADAFGLDLEGMKCLEVFGRYLLPGWTTVGDQCLLFQADHYFKEKDGTE
jgi:N6-adenosine-specific RNA methylase IME4